MDATWLVYWWHSAQQKPGRWHNVSSMCYAASMVSDLEDREYYRMLFDLTQQYIDDERKEEMKNDARA